MGTVELTDRQKVAKWLDSIGETDEEVRADVFNQCASDKTAREYYVRRWNEDYEYIKRIEGIN